MPGAPACPRCNSFLLEPDEGHFTCVLCGEVVYDSRLGQLPRERPSLYSAMVERPGFLARFHRLELSGD
jgi:hypothetical protein